MKVLKVKLSGTYLDSSSEIQEYDDLTGIIPFCDEGKAHQLCKSRYAGMWLSTQKNIRIKKMREVYMDSCKEGEAELSFLGKDIKEMSMEELQDLAAYLGIKIPLYKKSSLRNTRVKAVEVYMVEIKGVPVKKVSEVIELGFDSLPKFVINEKEEKSENVEVAKTLSEEMAEFGVDLIEEDVAQEYTMESLKDLAKAKDIKHHPNIGYDKLYAKVFAE